MINSISSNQNYPFETSKSSSSASTLLASISQKQKVSSLEEATKVLAVTSVEEYSAEEHLEMMRSAKVPPTYESSSGVSTAAGDISSIDADGDGTISADEYEEMISQMGIQNALTAEEFFAQYDTNEDGEISADEMPEPGTVGVSGGIANESFSPEQTDTSSSLSEELRNITLQALKVYENNYESMFETKDGSLLNNRA